MEAEAQERTKSALGLNDDEFTQLVNAIGLNELCEFTSMMEALLIADRIPDIVRRADQWLGGCSMLEALSERGIQPIKDYLERLQSYISE